MKLSQTKEGTWVLRHRSYFSLLLGLMFLGCIPYAVFRGHENVLLAILIYALFGTLCLWYFAEFSTLEISRTHIGYTRHLLVYKQKVVKDRKDVIAVTLETCSGNGNLSKRIRLSFADESVIVIPKSYVGTSIGWTIEDVYASVKKVFPELEQDHSDEITSLLAEGKTLEAIQRVRQQYGLNLRDAKAFVEELKTDLNVS